MKCAFFDMDETIVQCKSMFSFYKFFLTQTDSENHSQRFENLMTDIRNKVKDGASREIINSFYYEQMRGISRNKLRDLSQKWFNQSNDIIFIDKVVSEIERLKLNGFNIVLVSGAMEDIIYPIGNIIGADFYLCSEPLVSDGRYTGELIQQSIGDGKRALVIRFCQTHHIDTNDCIAYGDHISDIPMLTAVGKAFVVNPDHEMRKVLNEFKLNEI
ncbi:HAD family hydrolase [Vibrio navarrensis]|uniref:HAD family hydrolase n=2 Tax=Vibrio navarrensis TaxID=29495 RepID=UPI00186973DF|nr:HAD-IB family hydrolase [Vibrio navarrensis]MBE4609261.1 hypothetical protein [Vibrio navarrensis]